jgi:hypothetical protein
MGDTVLTTRRGTYAGPEKRRILVLRSLGVLSVMVVTTVVLLPTAGSATPSTTPPAIALAQVQSQLSAVTANADAPARAALADAVFQLGTAIPCGPI